MVKLSDLWIGDKVVMKKSKRIGSFVGISKNGKARIDCGDKIILSGASNLALYEEPPPKEDLSWISEGNIPAKAGVTDVIDLHFEKIRPDVSPDQVTNVLKHQIDAFHQYMEEVKQLGMEYVTIIHGKGEGILQGQIEALVLSDPDIVWYQSVNDGGAIQIRLRR